MPVDALFVEQTSQEAQLMARARNKSHGKTFQQRQSERAQVAARDRELVETMAAAYSCSNGIARTSPSSATYESTTSTSTYCAAR